MSPARTQGRHHPAPAPHPPPVTDSVRLSPHPAARTPRPLCPAALPRRGADFHRRARRLHPLPGGGGRQRRGGRRPLRDVRLRRRERLRARGAAQAAAVGARRGGAGERLRRAGDGLQRRRGGQVAGRLGRAPAPCAPPFSAEPAGPLRTLILLHAQAVSFYFEARSTVIFPEKSRRPISRRLAATAARAHRRTRRHAPPSPLIRRGVDRPKAPSRAGPGSADALAARHAVRVVQSLSLWNDTAAPARARSASVRCLGTARSASQSPLQAQPPLVEG